MEDIAAVTYTVECTEEQWHYTNCRWRTRVVSDTGENVHIYIYYNTKPKEWEYKVLNIEENQDINEETIDVKELLSIKEKYLHLIENQKQRQGSYYKRNKEKIRVRQRNYYSKNKEKFKEKYKKQKTSSETKKRFTKLDDR